MTNYEGAIFDLDGTLIDTERLAIATGYAALEPFGLPLTPGLFEGLVGRDEATVARVVAATYGNRFPFLEFSDRWNALFHQKLDEGVPLRPGVLDLLEILAGRGLPCAVATSSRRESALKKLSMTGLDRYFDTVVTFDCITSPKPAPDPFLEAARRLSLSPARCIAFEDSDTGAASARAAGMTVVQVPDMVPSTGPHAHHLAETLMDGARLAGLI